MGYLAALAATFSLAASAAETPPDAITWQVLVRINDFADNPDDPTDRPPVIRQPQPGTIRAVDISHDGKTDWLVDFQQTGAIGECGTGGCTQILYVSHGEGYVRAFERQAFSLTIQQAAGETRVEAWVHDLYCSPRGADCRFAWTWDAQTARLTPRPVGGTPSILPDGGFSPVDLRADQAPAGLSDWAAAQRRVCLVDYGEGYDVRKPILTIIPDVTGDGVDDWLALPTQTCGAEDAAAPGTTVWASHGPEAVTLAYGGRPDTTLSVKIGGAKARLLEVEACDLDTTCPGRPLQWSDADRSFKPTP